MVGAGQLAAQQASQQAAQEAAKQAAQEAAKNAAKEASKEAAKEGAKEASKEATKEAASSIKNPATEPGKGGTKAEDFQKADMKDINDAQRVQYRNNDNIKQIDSREVSVADSNGVQVKQDQYLYEKTNADGSKEQFKSTVDIKQPTAAEATAASEAQQRNIQLALTALPMIMSATQQS